MGRYPSGGSQADDEDLDSNPFFHALRTKFHRLYESAQLTKDVVICIPTASCAAAVPKITKDLLEAHIFRPSPFFAGKFVSDTKPETQISLEAGSSVVKCDSGFKYGGESEVLFQETFYNKKSQPFRVVCIDRVLTMKPPENSGRRRSSVLRPRTTVQEEEIFLANRAGIDGMHAVDREIGVFLDGYLIVQGYDAEVEKKLADMYEQLMVALEDAGVDLSDERVDAAVDEAVCCYVCKRCFPKILPVLQRLSETSMAQWRVALSKCRHASVTMEALGIRPELRADFSSVIRIISKLPSFTTPIEVQWWTKELIAAVSSAVDDHVARKRLKPQAISTEDLLPLLAFAFIEAEALTLPRYLLYTERFATDRMRSEPEFSYRFTTLSAAVETVLAHAEPLPRPPDSPPRHSPARSGHARPLSGSPRASRPGSRDWTPSSPPSWRAASASAGSHGAVSSPSRGGGSVRQPHEFGTFNSAHSGQQPSSLTPRGSTASASPSREGAREPNPKTIRADATATPEDMGDFLSKLALGL